MKQDESGYKLLSSMFLRVNHPYHHFVYFLYRAFFILLLFENKRHFTLDDDLNIITGNVGKVLVF